MNIFIKLIKYFKVKKYKKYKKQHCPKCNELNWKYCFAPHYQKGKKGAIEARVCGNCGYKDPNGHFISDEIKFNKDFKFKIKN